MKRILPFLVFAILLTSCSTTYNVGYSQHYIDDFVGLTHREIVDELGAPTKEMTDGGDGYILVYEGNRRLFTYSSEYAYRSNILPQAQFFMDENGVCRRVLVKDTNPVRVTNVGETVALILLILLLL